MIHIDLRRQDRNQKPCRTHFRADLGLIAERHSLPDVKHGCRCNPSNRIGYCDRGATCRLADVAVQHTAPSVDPAWQARTLQVIRGDVHAVARSLAATLREQQAV